MEELVNSFKLIVDGSVEGMPIENAVIIDRIDSRFEVVDQYGNPYKAGARVAGGTPSEGW